MKNINLVLATEIEYRVFYGTTSAMSNLDYDVVEITSLIFKELDSAKGIEERLEKLAESYKSLGSGTPDDIADGRIMSLAVKQLASALLDWVRKLELYDQTGHLQYEFADLLLGKNVLLTSKDAPNIEPVHTDRYLSPLRVSQLIKNMLTGQTRVDTKLNETPSSKVGRSFKQQVKPPKRSRGKR